MSRLKIGCLGAFGCLIALFTAICFFGVKRVGNTGTYEPLMIANLPASPWPAAQSARLRFSHFERKGLREIEIIDREIAGEDALAVARALRQAYFAVDPSVPPPWKPTDKPISKLYVSLEYNGKWSTARLVFPSKDHEQHVTVYLDNVSSSIRDVPFDSMPDAIREAFLKSGPESR